MSDLKSAAKLALEAFKKLGDFPHAFDECTNAIKSLEEALVQEQDEPLPDFYITEKMADSIYKLKSPTWPLCISGNKAPTMHRTIPVFVGYVKTKPAKQEQGEPVGYIANKRQRLNVELKPNAIVWMPTATDWELPLFTTPQPDQDEVEIRSRLYQRIHELEDLLRDIAEYKGEGPLTTDYRAIVKSISLSARSALGEEI